MSIRLIATDLDGTLLRSDKSISERTAVAMERAQAAGIMVVWATARARATVIDFAAMGRFTGLAICANGAVVLDLADDASVRHVTTIDNDTAAAVMDAIRSLVPDVTFAMVGTHDFVAEPLYRELTQFTDHWVQLNEMESSLPLTGLDAGTVKIVARHPEIATADLYRILQGAALEGVEVTHSLAPFVEMSAAGVTKATTLAMLAAELGIHRTEVAAIGDAANDLPMLEWAGLALAPANATEDVRAIADRILPANDDDGVAVFIESLLDLQ